MDSPFSCQARQFEAMTDDRAKHRAEQFKAHYRVPDLRGCGWGTQIVAVIGGGSFVAYVGGWWWWLFSAVLLVLGIGLVVAPRLSRVRAGNDGLFIRGLLKRRFVRFDQLKRVRPWCLKIGEKPKTFGVKIELTSGESFILVTRNAEQRDGLVRRLDASEDAFWLHDDELYEALVDHGVDPDVWLQKLKQLTIAPKKYRRSCFPPDTLWQVVHNDRANGDHRAAAAMALIPTLDQPGRRRLRIVAEHTADEKLRIAFAAAADESADDEQLAEALADVARASE